MFRVVGSAWSSSPKYEEYRVTGKNARIAPDESLDLEIMPRKVQPNNRILLCILEQSEKHKDFPWIMSYYFLSMNHDFL